MKEQTKKIAGVTGSALLLASMGAAGIAALPQQDAFAEPAADAAATEVADAVAAAPGKVTSAVVEGVFAFTQGDVTPIETIRQQFANAPAYLCGSEMPAADATAVDPGEWKITVGGDVQNAYIATLDAMAEEGSAQLTMGCTCAGNPADGRATVNAEVLGVRLAYIAHEAQPSEGVNTVVFTSEDGMEIALPYSYVRNHFSLIAYDVNGEPIANSMGGSNQLWLGSTAASYFARNVVSIDFETRQTPPPTPGTAEAGDAYANVPNVSVTDGGAL